MSTTDARLGAKVRALRRKDQLTQVQLAEKLGISPSYLNLIEHNQRPLTATLLLKLAQLFRVDLATFAGEDENRLATDLHEVFGDPLFEDHDVVVADARDVATNPAAARAIVTLYRAYREARETARALATRLSDTEGGETFGVDPSRLPSEEVSDVLQESRNHFPELEDASERLAMDAKLDRDDLYNGMVRYLETTHRIKVVVTSALNDGKAVRRFDPAKGTLAVSEVLPPRSRNFQVAHQIGILTLQQTFDRIVAKARLTTPDSVSLCRVALANYFAGALLMPYEPFRAAAENVRYDVELLGHRFRTSFEQVCHRITTLQRPGAEGVPFHLIRVDIAGNISKRFSASGIHFARFSGSCPRWNVHAAFMSPGNIRTQLSQMPDGTLYFCIARSIRNRRGGFGSPQALLAIGLGCEVSHAKRLVYSDGFDLSSCDAAVPIGTSCRLCERMDCEQRAFPSLQHRLSIDENVRGRSFYAPVG